MEESRSAFKILTDDPTEKKLLWSPKNRRKDNIRMYLKKISINKTHSAKDMDYWSLLNAALNLPVP